MDIDIEREIAELIKPRKVDLTEKQVNLLITLSDNKGHKPSELSKSIGSTESYVSNLLSDLSSHEFGGFSNAYSIYTFDLKDPLSLLHKLQDQRDSVSKYIFKKVPDLIKKKFTSSDMETILYSLSYGFKPALCDRNLYNKERFAHVNLSEGTNRLLILKEKLDVENIRLLNRNLISDAYPNEICKAKTSLIHQELRVVSNKSTILHFINSDLRTFNFIERKLEYEINLDKNRLDVMKARLENYGYEAFLDRTKLEKEIKDGRYDMIYFKKRYMKNINTLLNFLSSNYVEDVLNKYESKEEFKFTLPFSKESLNYEESVYIPKGFKFSLKQIPSIKQKLDQLAKMNAECK